MNHLPDTGNRLGCDQFVDGNKMVAASSPKETNTNSRGCEPTVWRSVASRPRRGRTGRAMPARFNPSGVGTVCRRCSVGCHPRLFTLNPSGIAARDREQTIARNVAEILEA